jgi:hypothetical protein
MLTPIEWWGGLIFVLGAGAYRLVMGALGRNDEGISWYRGFMHAFFVLPAVVLAGYFYPLPAPWQQYGYLGVLGASLLMVAAMLVQELMGDGRDEAAAKPNAAAPGPTMREGEEEGAAAARPKKAAQAEAEAEAQAQEDEAGRLATALGALVLYSPVLVACGLGCYKAWPLVQALR